jgi:site-specific recombinase
MKKKTLRKISGWFILIMLFLALFAVIAIDIGVVNAIISFVVAFGICGLACLGVNLIHD